MSPVGTSHDTAAIELIAAEKDWREGLLGRRRAALRGVDLVVGRGEAVMLLGANGAGKSTLLWLLAGLRRPTAGVVRLLGRAPQDPRARAALGLLPERPALPDGTVAGVLAQAARLHGLGGEAEARVAEVLGQLGLEAAAGARTTTLSQGLRQQVALARALLPAPAVLLLDEPLANVDADAVPRVLAAVDAARRRGAAVLVATHRPADWAPVCERAARLDAGRLRELGASAELLAASPSRVTALDGGGAWSLDAVPAAGREARLDALRAEGRRVVRVEPDVRA